MDTNKVLVGDCLEVLKTLPENSVDSIVTDPPYELGFMGKSWDSTGIANNKDMWAECLRVLKPGGHLLAFSGTRTYHRMASAIEDAGFEVRDMIEWVYGSGFPKSLNIGKAVDKLQGNERILTGEIKHHAQKGVAVAEERGAVGGGAFGQAKDEEITKGTSEWEGWGTALKPAHEPICMARKPLAEKTVAENCLKYGTGGINIDESRVGTDTISIHNAPKGTFAGGEPDRGSDTDSYRNSVGRFPANLIHDNSEEVRECFPETNPSKKRLLSGDEKKPQVNTFGNYTNRTEGGIDDNGGNASRFFKSIIYQAKASKSERNKGCEELDLQGIGSKGNGLGRVCETCGVSQLKPDECFCEVKSWVNPAKNGNNHPTVKPIALMEYLIKMVTPPKGIVLDPFAGSGSTLVAAKQNGYQYIGIELTPEYIPIIESRLKSAVKETLF